MIKINKFSKGVIIILAAVALTSCKCGKNKNTEQENIDLDEITRIEILDAPVEYIRRDLRTNEQVKLVRHDDGSLWACKVDSDDCALVTE